MSTSTLSPAVWRVLDRLQESGCKIRRNGSGFAFACPAHLDRNPSGTLSEGAEGRALVTCHAGCSTESILAAIDLRMGDLFVEPSPGAKQTRQVIARYQYRDPAGELRYEVLRYGPTKEFRQRRPAAGGGWTWNLQGVGRLPFRLPELLAAPLAQPVWIPEGEKDVELLVRLGLIASTNSGGAGKFGHELVPWFDGRDVIVVCDQDAAGWSHGFRLAHQLEPVAASVRIIDILPEGKDVSDVAQHVHAAGGRDDDVRRLLEAFADRDPMLLDDWTPVPCV